MSVLTGQKIAAYYDLFKGIEVTFTKELIQVTGLVTQQVHLKCGSDFWPCVLYSTSFQGAKIVVNIKSGLLEKLQRANNYISLRFCFQTFEQANPVTFFVTGRVAGSTPYGGSHDVFILTLQFTQRPPDDLIEIVGRVLDANVNSSKRKDERIILTVETQRKLKLMSKEGAAFIQGVPRRCVLRDLSFSGSKLIMLGVAKFLVDKETAVRFDFDVPRESFLVKGKFVHAGIVEGKKEMLALTMEFDEALVPMGYKMRINDYLNTVRADNRVNTGSEAETKAPPVKEKPAAKPENAVPQEKPKEAGEK